MGELLHILIPLPIPASVYGLVLMLIALRSGLVKVEHVKETAVFLIEIMPVMFIPAAAGLIDSWGVLRPLIVPIMIITVVITVFVMAVAGRATQYMIRRTSPQQSATKLDHPEEEPVEGDCGYGIF